MGKQPHQGNTQAENQPAKGSSQNQGHNEKNVSLLGETAKKGKTLFKYRV